MNHNKKNNRNVVVRRLLGMIISIAMIVALIPSTVFAAPTTYAAGKTYVAFSSDVHNDSSNQAANRLDSWINNTSATLGNVNFDTMGFCGDNSTSHVNDDPFWTNVQVMMDKVAANPKVNDNGIFTAGNHEWENGHVGTSSNATAKKIKIIGEAKNTSDYIVYCFGANDQSQSGTGFKSADMTTLENYLKNASTTKPIFILSHFPLHSYSSRSTKNANQMISLLNTYSDTHEIIFLWGHNHTLSDNHYDKVTTGNIDGTAIKFTYAAAGCMSDTEYSNGSNYVKGKGMVAEISGLDVTLTYYNANGTKVSSGTAVKPAGGTVVDPTVAVTGVSLNKNSIELTVGQSETLTATVAPGNATNKNVSWSSNNNNVAGVDNYGKVTAKAAGTAVITVTTQDGNRTAQCTVKVNAPVHTHNWDNGTVTKQPTCTEPGSKTIRCSGCTETMVESIPATGHKEVRDPAVAATCTATGKTEGSHCSVCNTVIKAQQTVAKTDHRFGAWQQTTAPTEDKDGVRTRTCSVCGIKETERIPALGHTTHKYPETGVVTKAPTCTTNGVMTYTCTGCSQTKTEVIPATGHTEVRDPAVAATCTATGKTEGSHCSVCNTVIKAQQTVAKTDHRYGAWQQTTVPTEDKDGVRTRTCSVCGTKETERIPALGHTTHKYPDTGVVTKVPTCTEAGVMTYTCTGCSQTRTEVIPTTGHTEVLDAAVEATCTTTGRTEGSHCSVCNTVIKEQQTIAKTDHSFGEWQETFAPTETEDGARTRTCSVCGTQETEKIPALGHITHVYPETGVITKAATCTEDGIITYTCMGCDMTREKAIPATGHQYVKSGDNQETCQNCGDTRLLVIDGIAKINGKWTVLAGGKIDTEYTGFGIVEDLELYFENGIATETTTDVIKDADGNIGSKGVWYNVVNSKVVHVDTVAQNSNGWWKITDGVVEFGYNGFASNEKGDWYIENGKVTFVMDDVIKDVNGILGKAGDWYYVKGSKVTYTNTVAKNASGWWCIHDGIVDFTCNSVEKNALGWWKITNGKVDFNYTGVAKNALGWWRIESGKVNFNFNGIASNANGSWYLVKGKVDFSYNGTVTYAGVKYKVVNGKATRIA